MGCAAKLSRTAISKFGFCDSTMNHSGGAVYGLKTLLAPSAQEQSLRVQFAGLVWHAMCHT